MARDQKVDMETEEVELPPLLQKLRNDLKTDRKTLLKDKAYTDPVQLRAFIAQYTFQRLDEIVKLFGQAFLDSYQLTVSTASQQERMRKFVIRELNSMGADLDDDDELPGVSPEVMDDFHAAFYALGSILQKELPSHQGAQDAYNTCADLLGKMSAELMGEEDEEDEEEEEPKDSKETENGDSSEEEEKTPAASASSPDTAAEPETDQPEAD